MSDCLSVCLSMSVCVSVPVQESARQAFTMYPSRNVDKVWEVATMLAQRDVHVTNNFHPVTTTAAVATATAVRLNVNGVYLYALIVVKNVLVVVSS